jgi:hypothetical protein
LFRFVSFLQALSRIFHHIQERFDSFFDVGVSLKTLFDTDSITWHASGLIGALGHLY